ncbi:hypothetical protein [uncultured Roseobacter sp.]|uniref:hypothetical protein n=1 Tax=uncultured Roseobacter sp. TaxID=114847 RepID=UPI002623F0A2|nr:hypothetical protein [uncultured Roseobacter sp.]
MDQEKQQQPQHEPNEDVLPRDLDKERAEFERMVERQSEASREYTRGKLLSA